MPVSMHLSIIEFSTERIERIVIGWVLVFMGGGALMFWNVERSKQWQALLILMIGAIFVGVGIFLVGYRRAVRLESGSGVSERRSLYGREILRRHHPLADFEAVGCHGSAADSMYLDVVLFRRGGGFLTLRTMRSNADTKQEITRVAECLGLPAEYKGRVRRYWIAGLD